MSDAVFIDSQGLIALVNRSDDFHTAAKAVMAELARRRRPVFTTDWVLAETGNGVARTPARAGFVEAVRRLQNSTHSTIIKIDDECFEQSLEMFHRAQDKDWGLVDCASFVVMRRQRITDALTNDRHFLQAGFRPLLTPD